MSQGSFTGGFFLGALFGGVLGGVVGAIATQRLTQAEDSDLDFGELSDELKRNLSSVTQEERMELARRGLEDKIAQLNSAIEDVRSQMSNGHTPTESAPLPRTYPDPGN